MGLWGSEVSPEGNKSYRKGSAQAWKQGPEQKMKAFCASEATSGAFCVIMGVTW